MASLNRRLRHLLGLPRRFVKGLMLALLRVLMISNRPDRLAKSGFVLPTTILLLLVVTLTAGALTYRSFSRSDQVIAQREQQVIQNAATPAIDRAKAKIEYVFQQEALPGGLPPSDVLRNLMLKDIYDLPDETRLDINGDGDEDNAWLFSADLDGDGDTEADEVIVYSVLMDHENTDVTPNVVIEQPESQDKAEALVTRTGPISAAQLSNACATGARVPEGGWYLVNASQDLAQKNFQINAFVLKRGAGADVNRTVETLEFQQSREANRGSKWGAWFDYDLEIYPGPEFRWNGAMHAESNLIVKDNFKGYMVSSNDSCIYSASASEITINDETEGDIASADFRGELVRGGMNTNDFTSGSTPEFHFFDGATAYPLEPGLTLGDNKNTASVRDSVEPEGGATPSVYDIMVNPVALYTEGERRHIDDSTWQRVNDWTASATVNGAIDERIYHKREREPFVDDFSRADNRWGPSTEYRGYNIPEIFNGVAGPPPVAPDTAVQIGADIDVDIPSNTYTGLIEGEGLDGFWERQATEAGLRLIVGERLELGNTFGWNIDPSTGNAPAAAPNIDPLYPANATAGSTAAPPTTVTPTSNYPGGVHEVLQRRTLRDNLAAVQSMAVYHYETTNGLYPAACMALTAHPGTEQAVLNSRTFERFASGSIRTDFLTGRGTNGWEFPWPATLDSDSDFAGAIATTEPLGIALRNLAHFAGDPYGGAPYFSPFQDRADGVADADDAVASVGEVVHPFPYMAMWGDFASLRRIFDDYLDNGIAYASLSPADKTTLHTATCTLGMLAYQLNQEMVEYIDALADISTADGDPASPLTDTALLAALDGIPGNPTVASVETAIASYDATLAPADQALFRQALDSVRRGDQVIRDRAYGFLTAGTPNFLPGLGITGVNRAAWNGLTLESVTPVAGRPAVKTGCDPDIFAVIPGISEKAKVALALHLCSKESADPDTDTPKAQIVKYPSLHYLFPLFPHDQDGDSDAAPVDGILLASTVGFDYIQPGSVSYGGTQVAEEFIAQPYITAVNNLSVADRYVYSVVEDPLAPNPAGGMAVIALAPSPAPTATPNWVLPVEQVADALTDPDDNAQAFRLNITVETPQVDPVTGAPVIDPVTGAPVVNVTNGAEVAFLDKGVFDGREQMSLRMLDIDVSRLVSDTNGSDNWLADGVRVRPDGTRISGEGVVYAFREDAVREDEIVRPFNSTVDFATCTTLDLATKTFPFETNAACYMRVDPTAGVFQDPPLSPTKISVKPVDFIPDPERRPFGFRFRNGEDFSDSNTRTSGMTFVTDNTVYTFGDFNLHSSDGTITNLVEEFTDTLFNQPTWGPADFYSQGGIGRTTAELNTSVAPNNEFANLQIDRWRPVEILADVTGILSSNFRDGSIADTFGLQTLGTNGDDGGGLTSYQNQNRPYWQNGDADYTADNWLQENEWQAVGVEGAGATESDKMITPVWISRNGSYHLGTPASTAPLDDTFVWFINSDRRVNNLITAAPTTVNATFVSGIIPTRPLQPNGGFHNFPRLNEFWKAGSANSSPKVPLNIAGAFIQLNFSTSAVGPFDQDAWEAGSVATAETSRFFYEPPERRWGYDVGLQYVAPAPVSRRFLTFGTPRSEYYRELPADDPYINLLRCATFDNGGTPERVDQSIDAAQCPDA